jgi:hypothetical protein
MDDMTTRCTDTIPHQALVSGEAKSRTPSNMAVWLDYPH